MDTRRDFDLCAPPRLSALAKTLGMAATALLWLSSSAAALDPLVEMKLRAADAVGGDRFGFSVAIKDDTIVVGALSDDSAYVFQWDGSVWRQQAKLLGAADAHLVAYATSGDVSGDYSSVVGYAGVCVHR